MRNSFMARNYLYVPGIFMLLMFADCYAQASGQFMKNLQSGRKQTIVTYGTSLTEHGGWVKQLQQALQERFPGLTTLVNSGKAAMWSQWGVENLDERVVSKKPDAVFIEFAINDAYLPYKTSVEQARANLTTMINRISAGNADCEVILMVMNPPTGIHLEQRPQIKLYNQMYRNVARERGLMLIDCYPEWEAILNTSPALFQRYVPDGIHPGNEGSEKITTPAIFKALGLN